MIRVGEVYWSGRNGWRKQWGTKNTGQSQAWHLEGQDVAVGRRRRNEGNARQACRVLEIMALIMCCMLNERWTSCGAPRPRILLPGAEVRRAARARACSGEHCQIKSGHTKRSWGFWSCIKRVGGDSHMGRCYRETSNILEMGAAPNTFYAQDCNKKNGVGRR